MYPWLVSAACLTVMHQNIYTLCRETWSQEMLSTGMCLNCYSWEAFSDFSHAECGTCSVLLRTSSCTCSLKEQSKYFRKQPLRQMRYWFTFLLHFSDSSLYLGCGKPGFMISLTLRLKFVPFSSVDIDGISLLNFSA